MAIKQTLPALIRFISKIQSDMYQSKIKIIVLFALAMALFACSQSGNNNNKDADKTVGHPPLTQNLDSLLVPGEAAGLIKIGADAMEVFELLGKADSSDAAMQKMVAFWYDEQGAERYSTSIYTVRDTGATPKARVQQIRVTSPTFKTATGIGISSTLANIQKEFKLRKIQSFSTQNNQLDVWDSDAGIAFEMSSRDACTEIIIHRKGEPLSGTYLPLR